MEATRIETLRRRTIVTSLVVGPALLAVASAAKVVNDPQPRAMLAAVAAHPDRAALSDAAQLAATVVLVPATIGILRFFRGGRGAFAGTIAVALIFVNLLGNTADVIHAALLHALVADGVTGGDVRLLAAVDGTALATAAELMVPLGLLGFPVLAIALWRTRTVPRWVPLVLVAGVACFFFPINEGVGAGVMAAAFLGLVGLLPGEALTVRAAAVPASDGVPGAAGLPASP